MERIVVHESLIQLRGVTKLFPVGNSTIPALAGIDLEIHAGEFIALRGPSGSGKSTLLNTLGLLEEISTGSLHFQGRDISQGADFLRTELRRNAVGFVFQNFNLLPILSAQENVEMPLYLQRRLPMREIRKRARALLEKVGLGHYLAHRPAQLSGGQRQRVAVARALINEPAIVLADEPTANLDSATAQQVLGLLQELQREKNTTLILATHDPAAARFASRTVCIRDGLLVDSVPTEDFAEPQSRA